MAKPRIFISSTNYDLKHVRADIERFIKEQGYDPVLNEKGQIPYGSLERLESYCYKEIELCDIVVGIIGGRYGSESNQENGYSISNVELKTAAKKGKQLYIFVDQQVLTEYRTYQRNKDNKSITYASVDNPKIFEFIDEVYALQTNNQIQGFMSVSDVTSHLKEQWAGLFQRLLSEETRKKELDIIDGINQTSMTLKSLVTYLAKEKDKSNETISDILLSSHPAFEDLRKKAGIGHRIFFQNRTELEELMNVYGYVNLPFDDDELDYYRDTNHIVISQEIFENNGALKVFTPDTWGEEYIKFSKMPEQQSHQTLFDDDIPF